MSWTCPECGSRNRNDLSRCVCGHDLNRPYHMSTEEDSGPPGSGEEKDALQQGTDAVPRQLELAFRGSAREYFRVWIVNLCLTLLTVGVFSAWAKVRKKRYLYSNTTLDNTPFQYLGRPVPILKGRVIAAFLFIVYYASSHYYTSLLPYVLAAGMLIAPWVIIRSAAFNASYSAFRNMTFRFDGGYLAALRTLSAWGIIPLFVAGMLFNWWQRPAAAAGVIVLFGLAFPWWMRGVRGFLIGHTSFGNKSGVFSARGGQFFRLYLTAGLIMAAALMAAAVLVGTLFAAAKEKPQLMVILLSVPVYSGYVLAYAYVQAHTGNLVWNHTQLGPLRFLSTLHGWGLAKLYVINAFGIVASLGLLIPWAVMRTVKYRVDHLQVHQHGKLEAFQGGEGGAVRAIGAETLDLFDVDLSL